MKEVVIVDAVRTPVGRYGGGLKDVRPDDLLAHVLMALAEKTKLDTSLVEDVIAGCANQAGEDNRNVARMSLLLAKYPEAVGGVTVNRLCGSSMDAFLQAARAIQSGDGDVYVVGGTESMSRAPFVMGKPESAFPRGDMKMFDTTLGWRFTNEKLAALHHPFTMGETAENVAERYKISREDQDEFALSSQRKYGEALNKGVFAEEIVPVPVPQRKGDPVLVSADEHPRPDTKPEDLKKLKPAFRKEGSVTAGNSSGINDGAAAMLVMSADKAKELGMKPLVKYRAGAVAGVDPACMGVGPVPASRKALQRAGLKTSDLDLIELNEAFAAQVLASARELELDLGRVNVNGGSIALGHPLGMSGARIIMTLAYEMRRRGAKHGLATMCIGVGQGIASVFELA